MANQKHLEILKQGVEVWNQWREDHSAAQIDLSGANLSKANLSGANLSFADLSGANLSRAMLGGADLHGANLEESILCGIYLSSNDLYSENLSEDYRSETNLSEANLRYSNLIKADLSYTNLSKADFGAADLSSADLSGANLEDVDFNGAGLTGVNFRGANLKGANFRGVSMAYTIFADVDLSQAKELLKIDHGGRSHIEMDTVKLPQDGSALHFLRGVGLPNEWIDFYRAQMMSPLQYYSCFISYSSHDEMLAKRLHADLQDQGVRCWFAPEDLKIGDKIRPRIDEAIHLQDKLLLLLSEHSLASTWVEDEVEAALEKEQRQQREVLFPVHLDESVMQTTQAWAAKLRRTRHIGDFTRWTDPQAYQKAFNRLLRDLKAKSERGETDSQ